MSTRINTNTTAFEAARNLSINSDNVSKNIQRLSSGLRINSASDDAAGLVISESLRAQSAGLTQATRNTNDAINVVKTAEGALNEVHSLLINVRQLIVHAANVGANDPTAAQADKDAVASAIASIDRIAGTTQFNHKNLLDGSASSATSATAYAAATSGTGASTVANTSGLAIGTQATTHASAQSAASVIYDQGTGKVTINGQTSDAGVAAAGTTTFSFSSGALSGLALTATTTALPTTGQASLGTYAQTADVAAKPAALAGQDLKFQIGANAGQTVALSVGDSRSAAIGSVGGKTLSSLGASGGLDLLDSTGTDQQAALAVVDKAIADISTTREKLGSVQSNVLETNVRSLAVAQQNTDASESTIRDTDLSSEIVNFTKNQILVQAGTSALAQANQAPQAILKLLQ